MKAHYHIVFNVDFCCTVDHDGDERSLINRLTENVDKIIEATNSQSADNVIAIQAPDDMQEPPNVNVQIVRFEDDDHGSYIEEDDDVLH